LSSRVKGVRHIRVLDIRCKIAKGWSMQDLLNYCKVNLGVTRVTAVSYIDEAAAPYREKYEEDQNATT